MIRQRKTITKTSSATLTVSEMGDVICDMSSAQTLTLPTVSAGLWYNFECIGAGDVSVSDGSVLATISQGQQALAVNDGTNWHVSVGGGGDSSGNIDGGYPDSTYGGTTAIDGGTP